MSSTEDQKPKKRATFTIVSGRENRHRGYGTGSINLNNVASVIIDKGEAYLDQGAIHGKAAIERRIRFTHVKEDVPNGRECWIVWVAVDRLDSGESYYAGVTACDMLIDEEGRKGYKILPDHVNKLDAALKRKYIFDGMNAEEKAALKKYLIEYNEQWWENSPDELHSGLA